ncbi:hypothetical protein SJ05684_b55610 (plasmid) [Sinorhizobium sojae CCBAU 05684]|uniref:Uncharacterized protein n=1 Tax=Sinorhizobium sojae CCBAU 05684 TaxID=716928 RepID=A0A249PKT6_9HYPH|nr:hypothetical protein SJ05684_b55610 [Sinorhizobium sojae CCBAU 05684]
MHADGYAGFRDLYEATQPDKPAAIQEAACGRMSAASSTI